MARRSFREIYEGVKKVPRKLKVLRRSTKKGNAKRILEFLLSSPSEIIIGEYWRKDRAVHFKDSVIWIFYVKDRERKRRIEVQTNIVPKMTVESAVRDLNEFFRLNKLPYAVWAECQSGSLQNRIGRHVGKEVAPFKIGLIDTRKPRNWVVFP